MLSSSEKFDLMQRRGWVCYYCGKKVNSAYGKVHHQNQNPNDDRPENLKVACRECHERITARYR
jgi:5-methylcytosine-specific restriction endonuclease McrA